MKLVLGACVACVALLAGCGGPARNTTPVSPVSKKTLAILQRVQKKVPYTITLPAYVPPGGRLVFVALQPQLPGRGALELLYVGGKWRLQINESLVHIKEPGVPKRVVKGMSLQELATNQFHVNNILWNDPKTGVAYDVYGKDLPLTTLVRSLASLRKLP